MREVAMLKARASEFPDFRKWLQGRDMHDAKRLPAVHHTPKSKRAKAFIKNGVELWLTSTTSNGASSPIHALAIRFRSILRPLCGTTASSMNTDVPAITQNNQVLRI